MVYLSAAMLLIRVHGPNAFSQPGPFKRTALKVWPEINISRHVVEGLGTMVQTVTGLLGYDIFIRLERL